MRISDLDLIKSSDKEYIIGIDECGYGALAGPLVIGAVRSPKNWNWKSLNDSKKLSEKKRVEIEAQIRASGDITFAISFYDANKLDSFAAKGKNIGNALRELYANAIEQLDTNNCLIVLDGIHTIEGIDHVSLPKADSLVPAVMAASVIAKVYRDNRMVELSKYYPNFEFNDNKGYPTAKHIEALEKFGLSAIHRRSYKVKSLEHLYWEKLK
jgi:ribonuclease HII